MSVCIVLGACIVSGVRIVVALIRGCGWGAQLQNPKKVQMPKSQRSKCPKGPKVTNQKNPSLLSALLGVEYQLMFKLKDENGDYIRLFQIKNESATNGLHYLTNVVLAKPTSEKQIEDSMHF
jgi:hypothetical protein